ncbi:MAG: hypothetical protein Ct9H300mP25_03100 [Acidobacteriota bacterium]|nr:MAG: hypothetical protein Ct9H300mP25_03100 [Acidobacteriota bacterium]
MGKTDPLALLQSRNAVTFGGDTNIRFADRAYEVRANVGLTHIDGEPEAIAGYQRRNGHLFHRIDQETIRFDGTSRSMNGAQITASLNKIAGRHWLWGYRTMIESPAFEPMDFGRLNFAGDIEGGAYADLSRDDPRPFSSILFHVDWVTHVHILRRGPWFSTQYSEFQSSDLFEFLEY